MEEGHSAPMKNVSLANFFNLHRMVGSIYLCPTQLYFCGRLKSRDLRPAASLSRISE